jgi:hypothetical protein
MSERFRTKVTQDREGWWRVEVYDLDDHGPDVPYAVVESPNRENAMREAGHYVAVAAQDEA